MLLILLDNAVKYTCTGGTIAVRMIEEANDVAIAVADSDAGIPPDDLPFIFDRFAQESRHARFTDALHPLRLIRFAFFHARRRRKARERENALRKMRRHAL